MHYGFKGLTGLLQSISGSCQFALLKLQVRPYRINGLSVVSNFERNTLKQHIGQNFSNQQPWKLARWQFLFYLFHLYSTSEIIAVA
jgi:hypothetical protein